MYVCKYMYIYIECAGGYQYSYGRNNSYTLSIKYNVFVFMYCLLNRHTWPTLNCLHKLSMMFLFFLSNKSTQSLSLQINKLIKLIKFCYFTAFTETKYPHFLFNSKTHPMFYSHLRSGCILLHETIFQVFT